MIMIKLIILILRAKTLLLIFIKTIRKDRKYIIGLDKYLISNKNGELYKSSSSFAKFFKNIFSEYDVYDLRRAICSRTIEEGITSKIKKLEYIQGHTIEVMLEFYNVYSKKRENNKEIIIGI